MTTAAILNSRQSLLPCGCDPWVINTGNAVTYARDRGLTLLTSTGMNSWELSLYWAARLGVRQIIMTPVRSDNPESIREYHMEQFLLNSELVNWNFLPKDSPHVKSQLAAVRDRKILETADILIPVSIRPRGNMDKYLAMERGRGKEIVDSFRVDYGKGRRHEKLSKADCTPAPKIDRLLENYLIHWTRTSNGPWPGESCYEYYNAVISSGEIYPRSAFCTLQRILKEKKLRGSPRHLRQGIKAVAFSSLKPSEAVTLMRWRARYREMTFEPYGIAIRRDHAERIGVRKVFYGNPEMFNYLEDSEKPFFQSIGVKGFWLPEGEYRFLGDLELKDLPIDASIILVASPDEAQSLAGYYQGRVVSLC